MLLKPWSHTRIGLHYRSAIEHDLAGKLQGAQSHRRRSPRGNGRTDADVKLNEPDVAAIGVAHEALPGTTLFAEAQWFNWSRFNELRVKFSDGRADSVRQQEWKDTWSFYGGIEQRLFENWTLRGGAGYEPTPTVDAFRNTSLPDGDRVRLAAGVSYDWSERLRIDFGYAHVFSQKERHRSHPDLLRGRRRGHRHDPRPRRACSSTISPCGCATASDAAAAVGGGCLDGGNGIWSYTGLIPRPVRGERVA